MDDALPVRRRERGEHLAGDLGGALRRETPLLAQRLREALAAHVLHDRVGRAVVLHAHVEHVDDVLVPHAGGRPRFALEPRDGHALVGEVVMQDLDRDRAPDGDVLGLVDRAHPAAPEDPAQAVLPADDGADEAARRGHHASRAGGVGGQHLSVVRPISLGAPCTHRG